MRTLSTLIAIIFIMIALLVFYLGFYQISLSRKKVEQQRFLSEAMIFGNGVKSHFRRHEELLRAVRGFFQASTFVSSDEWRDFSASLLDSESADGFIWTGVVWNAEEKGDYLKENNLVIWPKSDRKEPLPILYVFPNQYEEYRGFDLASQPAYLKTLEESLLAKQPLLGPPIRLNMSKADKYQRLLVLPIFKQDKLFGWAVEQVDFNHMLQSLYRDYNMGNMGVSVYLGSSPDRESLLFSKKITDKLYFKTATSFDVGGMTCFIEFEAGENFIPRRILSLPSLSLLSLLLLVCLYVIFLLVRYVGGRTLIKRDAYWQAEVIRSMPYALICADKSGLIFSFNPAAERLLGYSAEEMVGKKTPESFHVKEEMEARANDLSTILKRPVLPNFEVFVALAEMGYPENRRWTYQRKDGSLVSVQLSVSVLKDRSGNSIGYYGIAIEHDLIKFW